jgi:hypothetical protein
MTKNEDFGRWNIEKEGSDDDLDNDDDDYYNYGKDVDEERIYY